MDSIDIYVSLMDDIEVSRALKQFGEKTKSTNLAFKKTKLVKILRSQTSQTRVRGKSKKSRQNPFEFLIFEQKDDEFENIDENARQKAMILPMLPRIIMAKHACMQFMEVTL